MDGSLVQSLIEQRDAVNKKFDQQIMEAMGIAPASVKIGISMDGVGVGRDESFNSLPHEVRPLPGFYTLNDKLTQISFQIELIEIDKQENAKILWVDGQFERIFWLPLVVFNAMFVKIDDFIS